MAQEARWAAVMPSEVPRGLGEPQTILQSFCRAQGPCTVRQVQDSFAPAPGRSGVPVQKGLLPIHDHNGPVVRAITASVSAPVALTVTATVTTPVTAPHTALVTSAVRTPLTAPVTAPIVFPDTGKPLASTTGPAAD